MIRDYLLNFDDAHAYTATAISTNVIDLGPLGGGNLTRDIGAGEPLYLHILITTLVAASGGASTTVFTLESDDEPTLSSATIHWTGPSIAKATLVAGYAYAAGIAIPSGPYQRYLGLRFTPTTNDWSAGASSAWINNARYDTRVYGSGVTNSV